MLSTSGVTSNNELLTRVVNPAGLFGSGSGLTFIKTSGLFRARYDACK